MLRAPQTALDRPFLQVRVLYEIAFCFSISVARVMRAWFSDILLGSSLRTQVPRINLLSCMCTQRPLLWGDKC
ncbi:hypothetical protein Hanom_Chr02g00133181 [Helianthus anomalus]